MDRLNFRLDWNICIIVVLIFSFTCWAGANGMDRLNFRLDWNICIVVLILIFLSLAGLGQMGWTG